MSKNKVINLFGDKAIPNNGVKYSELLEQFISRFAKELDVFEFYDDIFEFGINAWNIANINRNIPKGEAEAALKLVLEREDHGKLLAKMIDYKRGNFNEFTKYIVDYELTEPTKGKAPVLTVVTQEEEHYLAEMDRKMEKDYSSHDDNFHENFVDRSAITIKPKQAFIDWYLNLNPLNEEDRVFIMTNLNQTNIYLVDDEIHDLQKWLKKKFDKFFTMELQEWHDNKKEWPQGRTFKQFSLWFHVETTNMVYDMEKRPVLKYE